MGFDLSGMNPNLSNPQPELPPMTERTSKHDENCGTHFRNNVWWWRPLWHFVCCSCENVLTDKDCEEGCMNNGHKICKTKANRIAKKLFKMINNGQVKEYEEGYKKELASLEQDDWAKSYPFSEENVRKFANFCANSGGFEIC